MGEMGKVRKVRSDKKREIQPTISRELKECIHRLSYITNTPIKLGAEDICTFGTKNKKVITLLSLNFRRDVKIDNTIYRGDINRAPVKKRTAAGQSERISIRFSSETYEVISALSYALDCTTSRACALLLDASVRDVDFINEFVERYLEVYVDAPRINELKQIFKYVNANNPYDEKISFPNFLSYLKDEVIISASKVSDSISDFIVNNWRK